MDKDVFPMVVRVRARAPLMEMAIFVPLRGEKREGTKNGSVAQWLSF